MCLQSAKNVMFFDIGWGAHVGVSPGKKEQPAGCGRRESLQKQYHDRPAKKRAGLRHDQFFAESHQPHRSS